MRMCFYFALLSLCEGFSVNLSYFTNGFTKINGKKFTCKKVCQSHITQQVVDGKVKPSVFENGRYYQKVGKNNNEANNQAQRDNKNVTLFPLSINGFSTVVVEKVYGLIVMAGTGYVTHPEA